MNTTNKITLLIIISLFVTACGSSGDSSSFRVRNIPPVVHSENVYLVEENTREAFQIKATDNSNIKYYLTGENADLLYVDIITGEVFFKEPTDYERRTTYKFNILIEDSLGNRTIKEIIINIKDDPDEDVITTVNSPTPLHNNNDEYFITTWKTDNEGVSNSKQITIPTIGDGYDYSVDWGDGTSSRHLTVDVTHTYAKAGIYEVKIVGEFPRIYFEKKHANHKSDALKLLSIDQWGEIEWSSMGGAFYGCANLKGKSLDKPDLSHVKEMHNMFYKASSFNQSIGDWDVSNVHIMNSLFNQAKKFDQDLSTWDVSNVISMKQIFQGVTLSVNNYDNLLIEWSKLSLQKNLLFHGGNSKYSDTAAVKKQLILDNFLWTIHDGGRYKSDYGKELIYNGGNSNGAVRNNIWVNLGFVYSISTRIYKQKRYLYTNNKEDNGGGYQAFPTKIGKTYKVKALLLGTDINQNKIFHPTIASYITIDSSLPTTTKIPDFSSKKITSDVDVAIEFEFIATSTTSYLSYRSTKAWNYANARAISVKEIIDDKIIALATIKAYADNHSNPTPTLDDYINVGLTDATEENVDSLNLLIRNINGHEEVDTLAKLKILLTRVKSCITLEDLKTKITNNENITHVNSECITDMSSLFLNNTHFNQDISKWNISNVTNMTDMFKGVTLSTSNYDRLLKSWSQQKVQENVEFNGGGSKYSSFTKISKDYLLHNFNWHITDGGIDLSTASDIWHNQSIPTQSDIVSVTFTVNPSAEKMNAIVGFSNEETSKYSDIAVSIRFAPLGYIDARDGNVFKKENTLMYKANETYTFRLEIDFNTHTYDIYITPKNELELTIGSDFNFRSEQSSLNSINNFIFYSKDNDILRVKNLLIK